MKTFEDVEVFLTEKKKKDEAFKKNKNKQTILFMKSL